MTNVLLLNASYEPLAIVPERRAISLMLRGCVEAASEEMLTIKTAASNLNIPIVIRLRRYVNVPQRGISWSRRGVLARDKFECIYCGITAGVVHRGKILKKQDFTIDHLIPRSRHGKNTWSNTACACFSCNQRKGDRKPHEAAMSLRWEPKMPRVDYVVATGQIPTAWKIFIK